jgi:methylase of polypeptide subunit release factors
MRVPELVTPEKAKRLRNFFAEAGYDEKTLAKALGTVELPSVRQRNLPRLLNRTQESNPLNALLRWFWIGNEQPVAAVEDFVPGPIADLLVESGLLGRRDGHLVPQVMLVPFEGFLVASHHTSRFDAGDPEMVLWPNPTTRLLLRFTIRGPVRQTLDLGTGTGILALQAASHSEQVVATDLNPRAIEFARFNAMLNGVTNVECLPGDGFDPVAGRKFDRIISNPPFFITPGSQFLFCDNPMDLDGLCRRLVREAPARLEPGGYFQMLCEWAQIGSQDWHERLGEWFQGTGCDAWVLKGNTVDPAQYAQERISEINRYPARDAELYDEYMAYYRQRRVEAIHKGLVAMRLRPGQNWILMEDVTDAPREAFGDAVERRFLARDFLAAHAADEQLLEIKPRISSHARLEQIFEPSGNGWQPSSLTLKLVKGFPSSASLQPLVAEFLSVFDGARTLGEMIDVLSAKVDAPPERVRTECLSVTRRLIEYGFVAW